MQDEDTEFVQPAWEEAFKKKKVRNGSPESG